MLPKPYKPPPIIVWSLPSPLKVKTLLTFIFTELFCLFLNFYTNGVMECLASVLWHLSLYISKIHLLHIVLFSSHCFILFYDYTPICLSIFHLMDIGVFQFGDILSSAAMNVLAQVFGVYEWMMFNIFLGVRLLCIKMCTYI